MVKILFFAAGNMAGAIIQRLLDINYNNDITVVSKSNFAHYQQLNIKVYASIDLVNLSDFNIIFLGMKPNGCIPYLQNIKDKCGNVTIVSMMASITTELIAQYCNVNVNQVIRIMPNMGVKFGKSITIATNNANNNATVKNILTHCGTILPAKEDDFNKLTAVFGCGSAFILLLMQNINEYIKEITGDNGSILIADMLHTTLQLINNGTIDINTVIESIASKGGMTQAGLDFMNSSNTKQAVNTLFNIAANKGSEIMNNINK
jgi:pyrroline-5-carboxylate reductase